MRSHAWNGAYWERRKREFRNRQTWRRIAGIRQAGALQQPRRAQYQALCHGPQKFFVLQYTRRCEEQCCPLQSD